MVRRWLCVVLLVLPAFVFSIPSTINYQGKLTNAAGVGVNDTLSMEFRLYDVPTGGTPLWSETHPNVVVNRGLFDVILGSINPIDLPFDTQYYVEIVVSGEVLSPRVPLSSIGYAFRAAVSDSSLVTVQSYAASFADSAGAVAWSDISAIPAGFADGVDDVNDADADAANELITDVSYESAGEDILRITEAGTNWDVTIDNEADDLSDNVLNDLLDVSASPSDGQVLTWNASLSCWEARSVPGDNWGSQVAQVSSPITGNGTSASPLGLSYGNGLTLSGDALVVNAGTGLGFLSGQLINTGDTDASDDLTTSTTFSGDVSGPYDNLQLGTGVVGNAEISNSAVFVDVQDGSGTSQFTVTDGDRALQFAGTGGASVSFDAANHRVTIDASGASDGNNYVNGISFDTGTGVLTLSRLGLSSLTEDLDGRYAIASELSDNNNATTPVNWADLANVPAGFADGVDDVDDADADATNELQTINAGDGLTGGGSGSTITLHVGAGTGITVSADAVSVDASWVSSNYIDEGQSAGGDLSGTYPDPTVVGLQGRSVSPTAPSTGQVLKWNGSAWAPAPDSVGSASPAGSNGQIQYNDGGSFGGADDFYYDDANDRVGLGTSSPDAKLHISDPGFRGELYLFGYLTGTDDISYDGGTDSKFWFTHIGADTGDVRFRWYDGATVHDLLVLKNNGNVGVGTSAPSYKLDVSGDVRASAFYDAENTSYFLNPSSIGDALKVKGNAIFDINGNGWGFRAPFASSSEINFRPSSGSGNLQIGSSTGRNGIITFGGAYWYDAAGVSGDPTPPSYDAGSVYGMYPTSTGIRWYDGSSWQTITPGGGISGSGSTGYLARWTGATSLGNSVVYDDGTNVGIGTTSPAYKLDVSGSIRATGQLVSTVSTGTAPVSVSSTTLCSNLNADMVDGHHYNSNWDNWEDMGDYLRPTGGIGDNLRVADVQDYIYGIFVDMNTGSSGGYAARFYQTNSGSHCYGLYAEANFTGSSNTSFTYGGFITSTSTTQDQYGLYIYADHTGTGSSFVRGLDINAYQASGNTANIYGIDLYSYRYGNDGINYGINSYASGGTYVYAVYGWAADASTESWGVYGRGNDIGVYGYGWQDYAVYGMTPADSSTDGVAGVGSGAGVLLHSGSGDGVVGVSDAGYGVIGSHYNGSDNDRWGALGLSNIGVYGTSDSSSGAGVFGDGGTETDGVYGQSNSGSTFGVYGVNINSVGDGILGLGSNNTHMLHSGDGDGVVGASDAGYGVIGSYYDGFDNNRYGYLGGSSYGVYGHNDTGHAVRGEAVRSSADDYGVYGTCQVSDWYGYGGYFKGGYRGVHGYVTPSGDHTYYGVFGAVSGGSGTNYGVYGSASGSGDDYGGAFVGGSAWAEIAYEESSGDTVGAYLDGGTAFAYVAHDHGTDDTYGGYFDGNSSTNDYAYVGLHYSGTDYKINGGGSVATIMETRIGRRNLICPESPEFWFIDMGSARLVNGHCHVELDPVFLDCVTIDEDHPMKVFIQLNDNCNGVYVKKGKTGFDVYELNGGTSNASFDWLVAAKRKGDEDKRFPPAPPRQRKKQNWLDHTKDIWQIPQEYRLEWVKQVPPEERDPEWLKALTPEQVEALGADPIRQDPLKRAVQVTVRPKTPPQTPKATSAVPPPPPPDHSDEMQKPDPTTGRPPHVEAK